MVKLRYGGHIKGEGNYQRVLMGLRVFQRAVKRPEVMSEGSFLLLWLDLGSRWWLLGIPLLSTNASDPSLGGWEARGV